MKQRYLGHFLMLYIANKRDKLRERYGLRGCYVVGHVGTFLPVKNHKFILEVFRTVHAKKKMPDWF